MNAATLPGPSDECALLRERIRAATYADEAQIVRELLRTVRLSAAQRTRIVERAQAYVRHARGCKAQRNVLDLFLEEFGLSNKEGIALLCLAEALLRVPDAPTADDLIAEKLQMGRWDEHRGQSDSGFVNAATRALSFTAGIVRTDDEDRPESWFKSLVGRLGEPVVRAAARSAMRIMGGQFVAGRTIDEALGQLGEPLASFDMLGEGARTAPDAARHLQAYMLAIERTARATRGGVLRGHGVSIKLSALHPRYEFSQRERVLQELLPDVRTLAMAAREGNIHMTIDAEEAARLDLSLDIFESLARDPALADWQGLGLALQCYSKRALPLIDWLIALGRETNRRFLVRLVKGAYWDSEIKRAQEIGAPGYPVFTRKVTTDLSYLACAQRALAHPEQIYPQFATHNAHTVAAILEMAGTAQDRGHGFEFQRLHGMGELLYASIREIERDFPPLRVYAPVGTHKDLLAYLVRRLLENGANTSFVNRFMDEDMPVDRLVRDPVATVEALETIPHPRIPLPIDLYGAERRNSRGIDLNHPHEVARLLGALDELRGTTWYAAPTRVAAADAAGRPTSDTPGQPVRNPADRADIVGYVRDATLADVTVAVAAACAAQPSWDARGGTERAAILEHIADGLERERDRFLSLLVREAGKTLGDAVAEVREAEDFCRFYAAQARREFTGARRLPGPTGEDNLYSLHGRGVFVCISPWNFPLAIFTGQITAALAAGNAVLAKPAEQTPLIAAAAIDLMHRCGVPEDVLALLPGPGERVGAALVADERIAGVVMTGATATAKIIARALAGRRGPIVPLIAETGGQNAMFVDSTALPEQVVDDVIRSAFHSAGQRCSALRVLFVQEEVADQVIEMIRGAMDQLALGDPAELATDIGPVIDEEARRNLLAHIEALRAEGRLLHAVEPGAHTARGTFVAPHMFVIDGVETLTAEHFGPILHVVRYRSQDLDKHLAALRALEFGLTLGIHSRIEGAAERIFDASLAGNVYVNRNMIGAVVGVQPFGGYGLSGTGPKAGGPLYLHRFAVERVLTVNTAATGGNASLLSLEDEV
ncbi:MAG: bifunctional proline dehydrogenase/L-glutamate gamma-semialdehyde dehydrogenase [Proteobacteria bacterium]|nr:MAG: bifunctional proline dehydrogenase/L-glutamate gamma-semialdehyde dehydrogenase [Pseudomonadota bacterium]